MTSYADRTKVYQFAVQHAERCAQQVGTMNQAQIQLLCRQVLLDGEWYGPIQFAYFPHNSAEQIQDVYKLVKEMALTNAPKSL